jgi:type II secretory pathway pseudopilin PulG
MRKRLASAAGFTLVEMLVATAIMMVVVAGVFAALNPSQGSYQTQPEVSDMQQRLRVAVDSLSKDLLMAGAGTYSGTLLGALDNYFAPVTPYRLGGTSPDAAGTFRSDAITLIYVETSAAQTTISDPMPQPSAELKVNAQAGCPSGDLLCGFREGMMVIIFDDSGSWDPFTITQVQGPALHLQHRGQVFSKAYPAGSYIAQIGFHVYYLLADDSTETYELRHFDGFQTDQAVADNVVALNFQYFGDPQPPALKKPVTDPTGPWTTYGAKPPALGVDNSFDDYPAGENCVFKVEGGQQVSRLPVLAAGSNGLVALTPAMLTDGPWCPSSDVASRYDADLLRIREIRVTLRVQEAAKRLRGPAGVLFAHGGTSSGGDRYVPDQQVQFDITPRNMNLGR